MSDAVARLHGTKPTADVWVSVHGTGQRKGFLSTLGVVTTISIDNGQLSQNCDLNYAGPSPGMETATATRIFSLSKEKHGIYYTSF